MNALEAVKAWQSWAQENENYAGDVTVPKSSDTSFWFTDDCARVGAQHFHCFANGGDGSLIALWSQKGGAFEDAPVVVLGHEGQVALLAPTVPEALGIIAAAGSESIETTLLTGELGDPDPKLSAFLRKTFGVAVPKKFANPERHTAGLIQFLKKLTGNEYGAYCF